MESNILPGSQIMRVPVGGMNILNPGFPNTMFKPAPLGGGLLNEQQQKKKQFSRGIFVSGFEKSVTTAMIQKHFNIKPINGLRHPVTKLNESKGFAFIYYGSEDDALYVKRTLDRTAILHDKIRITRTVISQNLSKMMIKLKTIGLSEKEVKENQAKYFNDENLQKEVQRIIKPHFGGSVEVNKITIPHSKKDKKPLRYARVFFYVSDIKQGSRVASSGFAADSQMINSDKNQYEKILSWINQLLRNDASFTKNCTSQIYQYTKKNQSNVIHIKGIKYNNNQEPGALSEQLKDFFQKLNPQWNIVNAYAAYYTRGAWANITFSTYQQTIQAYEVLKNTRPKFRDNVLYGSLRNVKDSRTVVVSVVRKDVDQKKVEKFLSELAAQSPKIANQTGDQNLKKYDYFSFNIIESKKFYKNDNNESQGVVESERDQVKPSWIEINEVPRRLIIHFFNQFTQEDVKELTNNIRILPSYQSIFLIGDSKKQLRSNHQKGHVNKDGVYIKHTEIKGKRKVRNQNNRPFRQPRNNDPTKNNKSRTNVDFKMFSLGGLGGGIPKVNANMNIRPSIPQIGQMNMPSGLSFLPGSLTTGLPGSIQPNLSGMMPLSNLSGNLPTNLSTLPGNLSALGGMRPGIGPNPSSIGSQPPATGQQPPLGTFPNSFKPPGLPGMPGLGGLPGLSNLPGTNINNLPPQNLGIKPPGTTPINPLGNPIQKPPQK